MSTNSEGVTAKLTEDDLVRATVLIQTKLNLKPRVFMGASVHPGTRTGSAGNGNGDGHGYVTQRTYIDASNRLLSVEDVKKAFPTYSLSQALHCIDSVFTMRQAALQDGKSQYQYIIDVKELIMNQSRAKGRSEQGSKNADVDKMVVDLQNLIPVKLNLNAKRATPKPSATIKWPSLS